MQRWGKQTVRDAEDREQHDRDEEPGAVLIDIDKLYFIFITPGKLAATAEQKEF
jgi:hypothetical protein